MKLEEAFKLYKDKKTFLFREKWDENTTCLPMAFPIEVLEWAYEKSPQEQNKLNFLSQEHLEADDWVAINGEKDE